MNNEFKKVKSDNETRYVLESASAGATSAGSIASVAGSVGKVQKRENILAQEANKKKEAPKPRNFVAKNAKMGGAGKMQDKSKTIPRKEKHKKAIAEGYYDLDQGNVPGMEPIDFSSKPSFKELITRYTQLVYQGHASETSPEEDQEYDDIEKYVAQRFGDKGSAHLQKAGQVSYWGRDDKPFGRDSRSSNLGRPNQPSGDFRTTKAGKMHGQDAKMMKGKVADRLGRHPEPNLPEGFNGEYDDEAGMAHSNLLTTARAVMGLLKTIKDRDNLPEWGQEKIAKAEMMLVSVWDYLQSQKQMGNDPQVEAYGRYDRRDAYQRDYDHSVAGMDRGNNHRDDERHDLDPSDWYIVKDGKMFKVSVYPNQEQEAMSRGYSRTRDEAKAKAGQQGVAEGERTMSRAAKGHEKYGKAGMAALAKAGRDGAGEEKLDKIRDKHDKYNEGVAGPEKCWPGHRKVGTKPGTGKNAGKRVNDCEKIGEQGVAEVSPPGWEKTVKAMKKHDNIDNPFALAWSMKNKGYKSHKKESADPYFESLRAQVEELAKK